MATREDFLAPLRSDPAFAGFSDDILLEASKNNPGFDPSWLPAAPSRIAPIAPAEAPTRTIGQMVADTGLAILGGAGNVLEGADTLAQLATRQTDFTPFQNVAQLPGRLAGFVAEAAAGRADTAFEAAGEGPVKISDLAQGLKSAALKNSMDERSRAVAEAEPILGYKWMGEVAEFFKSTAVNPSLVLDMVAEQVPILLTGAVVGGAARALGATEKTAAAVAAGLASIQQGGDVAGGALSSITATLRDMPDAEAVKIPQIAALMADGSTLEAAKTSLALTQATKAGLAGTLASIASTRLMGAPLEELLVKLSRPAATAVAGAAGKAEAFSLGKAVTGALKTGAKEGFQEVGEEVPGQLFQNMAQLPVNPNIDLTQGLGASGAGAFLGGFVTGGGLNFASEFATSSSPEIVKQEKVAPKPEKAQVEFSFDVPPPVVGQTTFVAPADVWDDSVGGFVGASFVGRTQAEADAKREEAGLKPVANMTPEEMVVYVAAIRAKQPVQVADATAKSAELVAKLRGFGISNAKISQLDTVSAVEVAKAADAAIAKVLADRELESEAYQQRLSANVQTRLEMVKQLAVEGTAQDAAAVAGQRVLPGTEAAVLTQGEPVIGATGTLDVAAPAGVPEGQTEFAFPKAVKVTGKVSVEPAAPAFTPGDIVPSTGITAPSAAEQTAQIKPKKVKVKAPVTEQPVVPPSTEQPPAVAPSVPSVSGVSYAPAVKFTPSPEGVFINSMATAPIADLKTGAKSTKTESIVAVEYEVPDMPGVRVLVPVYTPKGADGVRVITQTESRSAFIKLVKEVSARTLGGWLTSSPDNQKKANALLAAVGYDRHNGKSTPSELAADRGWTLTGKVATLNQPLTAGMYTDLKMGAAPTAPVVVSSVTQDKAPAAEDRSDILKKLEKKFGMVNAKGERKKVAPAKPKSALDSQLDKITFNPRTLREFTGMESAADALGYLATQPDVMTGAAATAMVRTALVAQAQVTGDVSADDAFDDASASSPETTDKSSLEKVYFSLLRAFAGEIAQEARKADETKQLENNSLAQEAEAEFGSRKFRELSEQESRELNSTKVQESLVRDAQLAKQMTAYGLDVTAAQMAGAHAATYYKGLISVIADYTTLPSGTTFNSMLHEFGHFVWEKASPATQLALQRGAAELAKRVQGRTDIDRRVGKGSYAEYLAGNPGVPLTEARWAEEVVVETAMLNGVERPEAASLWRALWREMKTALLNSAMWLENLMTGQVNTDTAQAWMDNHIAAVIAGDRLRWVSYLNNFNVRPTLGQFVRGHMTPGREWLAEVYNGGTVEYHNISGLSPDAVSAAMKAKFAQLRQSLAQSGIWNREQNVADLGALIGMEAAARELPSAAKVPEVRDSEGRLVAPNGKPSKLSDAQWRLVRTPEFKNWFGDWQNSPETASKVVDENGEPMVVYHGTRAEFDTFERAGVTDPGYMGLGFYFATDKTTALGYAYLKEDMVKNVFLNIRNLKSIRDIYPINPEGEFRPWLGAEKKLLDAKKEVQETILKIKEMGGMITINEKKPHLTEISPPPTKKLTYEEVVGGGLEAQSALFDEFVDLASRYRSLVLEIELQLSPEVTRLKRLPEPSESPIQKHFSAVFEVERRAADLSESSRGARGAALKKVLVSLGADGIEGHDTEHQAGETEEREFVVFNPNQIKSATGNNGDFSTSDPRISHREIDTRKASLAASAQQAIGLARSRIAAANEMRKPLFALLEAIKKNQVPLTPEVRASAKARGEFVPEPITDIAQLSKMLGVADPEATALKAREQLKASLLEFGVDIKEVPASLIAGTTKLTDLTLQPDIDMSYSELNKAVGSAKALTINKMEAARERTAKLVLDVERLNKKLAKFSRNPLDAMAHIENLFDTLRTDIAELAASSRRVDQAGDAVSEVEATMASLYGAQELAADKSKMTDTLVEKALGEKVAFFPIMGELFQLEADGVIDLANDPATKIRDAIFARAASEPDSALNDIVVKTKEDRLRGTAFLSALITYTKRNAMETDMMRAAILKKEGDLAAVTRLQSILREANDAKLDEIRAELARKNTRLPSERLIQRVLNARDDLNRKKVALAIAERDAAVLRSARETFDLLNGRIEDELTITGEYVHHNGAKFVVAKSADMSLNDLFGKDNLRTLVTTGNEKITEAELRQIIADNGVWLEANKNKDLGIRYQQLLMQQKVMQKALHGGAATELMYGLGEVRLTSFARQLAGTGTEAGRRLASMMNEISLFSNRFAKKDSVMGDKWEKAMDVLRKASGIADYQEFRKTVYDPLGQHLDSIMDDFDGALARFERTLSPEMMARPGFKQALRELAVDIAEKAKYQNEKQKAGGPVTSLVLDPTVEVSDPYDPEGKAKTTQLRRQIDRGAVTFPQTTAQAIRNWVSSRDQKFSQNSHLGNPFSSDRKIFEKLIGSKADTATAMKMFLGDNGWEIFMKPLLTNIRGFVPRPIGPDGAVVAINPTTAEVFAAGSNENLDTFIEKAYAHYLDQHSDAIAQRDTEIAAAQRERDAGGVVEIPEPLVMETPEAYRSRVLDFVGRVWRELDTSINDRSKPNSLNQLVGFQNIGIDARASATWPMEWKSPQHFGTEDNRSATRSIATTAAIGRNGQDAAALINDMIADIAKQKSELAAKVPGETEDDQIEAKLKGDDRKKFKALRAYEKINWVGTLVDSLKNEKGLADDNKALMEAWSSYVVVMVSGLTNALKNFISPSNFMTLEGEVSRESIADVGGAYADAGKQLLGSVAQTLGIDLFKDDSIINAVLAEGYGDPATDKRTADLLVGGRGVRGNLGKTAHAFRTLTNIYKDSRIGASFGGRFPALRLLNPFAFTQVLVTLAAQVRLVKVYSQITDRMVDFYKTGGNPAKVLTASDLGFKVNRFDNLTLKAKLSGARDLQLIAQETMAARKTNPDYIHPDLVHLAARLASDKISVEGSLASNHPFFSRSRGGKMAGTLLGWPIRQTWEYMDAFSDPRNKKSNQAWLRGAKLVVLGALPTALLFSALLDEWDEITGKPKAKTSIWRAENLEQFFRGLMDAFVDTGVLGIATDVPALVVNSTMASVNKGPLLSLDNRVVAVSVAQKFLSYLQQVVAVGPQGMKSDYMGSRGLDAIGLGTPMRNADVLNNLTGGVLSEIPLVGGVLEDVESQRLRTGANNVIRAAAADLKLQLKTFNGSMGAMSPSTPHVYDMVWAGLQDDQAGFDKALARALKAETDQGKSPMAARDAVKSKYASRDPWSNVLRDKPTPLQIQEMYKRMGERRKYVDYAIKQFNEYGAKIGVQSTRGSTRMSDASRKWTNERPDKQGWFFGN